MALRAELPTSAAPVGPSELVEVLDREPRKGIAVPAADRPSVEEALAEAVESDVDGAVGARVQAEHLAPIALQTRRAKDKPRVLQFLEEVALEAARIQDIVRRHGLVASRARFERQFLSDPVMSDAVQKILASKRALRSEVAAKPVAEKLRLLAMMREREVAIRASSGKTEWQGNRDAKSTWRRASRHGRRVRSPV